MYLVSLHPVVKRSFANAEDLCRLPSISPGILQSRDKLFAFVIAFCVRTQRAWRAFRGFEKQIIGVDNGLISHDASSFEYVAEFANVALPLMALERSDCRVV